MKSNEKKMILILIIITIVVYIISVNVKKRNHSDDETEVIKDSEYVTTYEDGTKENTSSKLQEEKRLGDYTISGISVTSQNDDITVIANITNNTGTISPEFSFRIIVLNEDGEEIGELGAYVNKMKNEETKMIHASTNMDINEIYDFRFEF